MSPVDPFSLNTWIASHVYVIRIPSIRIGHDCTRAQSSFSVVGSLLRTHPTSMRRVCMWGLVSLWPPASPSCCWLRVAVQSKICLCYDYALHLGVDNKQIPSQTRSYIKQETTPTHVQWFASFRVVAAWSFVCCLVRVGKELQFYTIFSRASRIQTWKPCAPPPSIIL